uniref:Uncharacterized protein n=1 Tax=Arundo donax TaxID=35708 RepID=A0A0A8ZR27_ARUDO
MIAEDRSTAMFSIS